MCAFRTSADTERTQPLGQSGRVSTDSVSPMHTARASQLGGYMGTSASISDAGGGAAGLRRGGASGDTNRIEGSHAYDEAQVLSTCVECHSAMPGSSCRRRSRPSMPLSRQIDYPRH